MQRLVLVVAAITMASGKKRMNLCEMCCCGCEEQKVDGTCYRTNFTANVMKDSTNVVRVS